MFRAGTISNVIPHHEVCCCTRLRPLCPPLCRPSLTGSTPPPIANLRYRSNYSFPLTVCAGPRELHTLFCVAPQRSSSSGAGKKLVHNKERRENFAQNLQAPSRIEAVMYENRAQYLRLTFAHSLDSISTPHLFVVAQVIRLRLLKWLAAFCVLGRVSATALPSPSSPRFEAVAADPPYKPVR